MLDIQNSRRAGLEQVKERMEIAEKRLVSLQEQVSSLQQVKYSPPKDIKSTSDEDLNEAIYKTAQMYGVWRRIEASANALMKSLKTLENALEAVLRQQIYISSSKDIKDDLLQDKEYFRMQGIGFHLQVDVMGVAEGEAKAWSRVNESLSRVVELRRESNRGRSGR